MRVLRSVFLVVVLVTQLGTIPVRAQTDDEALYAPLLDEVQAEIATALDDSLPRYEIEASLTAASETDLAELTGTLALGYVNTSGAAQTELNLRLYPNNRQYGEGGMTLDRVTIDGATVDGAYALDDTLLTVELSTPLADGDRLAIGVDFVSTIPTDPDEGYGMFKYDSAFDTYALAHWFPMLAGIDADGAWLTAPLSENGDPVFANAALFDVQLEAPAELVIVTSGSAVDDGTAVTQGVVAHRFTSGPSRDFVMAASEAFEVVEEQVGDTTVRSYAVDGSEEGNELVLTGAAQSLAIFNRLLGAYPYEELDLVQLPLGDGAGGVEFPGILYIGADYYDDGPSDGIVPSFLEFIVAHEVGHQWWYAVVGNNQYEHAFIDEALTNYLTVVYFYEQYGEEAGDQQVAFQLTLPYFNLLFEGRDEIVDQPTDDFRSGQSYGAIVYGKGALGFGALREEIGDEAFFAALRSYYDAFQFEVATPDDLLAAFETASGRQLDEFWRHWFQAAEGDQDYDATDLADLLIEIGT